VPSITALCQRLGLRKQYAWMLWHGKIGLSAAMLRRLHAELGIPLEELLQVERATPAKAAGRKTRRQRLKARRPVTAAPTPAPAPMVEAEPEAPGEFSLASQEKSGPAPADDPLMRQLPQDRKAAVLARLLAMQAEGLSLQAMVNRLYADQVPTLSGKARWQKGTIGNLLAQAQEGQA
jgi:transcriptional regulator with XRE-family HTH domain